MRQNGVNQNNEIRFCLLLPYIIEVWWRIKLLTLLLLQQQQQQLNHMIVNLIGIKCQPIMGFCSLHFRIEKAKRVYIAGWGVGELHVVQLMFIRRNQYSIKDSWPISCRGMTAGAVVISATVISFRSPFRLFSRWVRKRCGEGLWHRLARRWRLVCECLSYGRRFELSDSECIWRPRRGKVKWATSDNMMIVDIRAYVRCGLVRGKSNLYGMPWSNVLNRVSEWFVGTMSHRQRSHDNQWCPYWPWSSGCNRNTQIIRPLRSDTHWLPGEIRTDHSSECLRPY